MIPLDIDGASLAEYRFQLPSGRQDPAQLARQGLRQFVAYGEGAEFAFLRRVPARGTQEALCTADQSKESAQRRQKRAHAWSNMT